MSAPLPADEAKRLEALRAYEVLDAAPEEAFDDLTMLAAHICQVPTAMVSLVDERRQWFKSRIGMDAAETSRDGAFCAQAILHADILLEVTDAAADPRFAGSELVVSGPQVRFYAGAPLVTPDGQALGALCVMDRVPRCLTAEQRTALRALSRRVVAQLELRRHARKLAAGEEETRRLLTVAEKSRRALLSLIEDQRRTEIALRSSEERFRQIAENISEVFWMTDVVKQRVLYISPGYEKIWGRTCASLYANPLSWVESIHEEDRSRVTAAATTRQVLGTYDETYRVIRPDGSLRWIHDRAFPVREAAGVVSRVVGVAEDITEQRVMERQFLQAQRLEAIGTLAGGIAHDLNNILAPMLMVAPLLKDRLPDPREIELITMIEQGARRGANIIRQLLTFSRGIEGERGPVQARYLLKEMAAIIRETFPREITVREQIPPDLWPILADATQIHQVLMNLCVNARDAMRHGGTLSLAARNVMLGEADLLPHPKSRPGPYLRLEIADTGEGIPREHLDRIFEPFFTTKEIGRGTGLGLSTVIGIVKSHGGFVAVASEVGRGSAFTVCLPAAVGAAEGEMPSPTARELGQNELILVVDDEAPVLRAISLALEAHNYRVLTAHDGREALAVFAQHREGIRLVVTDIMMPGMSGVALIRALRALEPGLRIIAASGLHDQDRRDELALLGVTAILAKPCGQTELSSAVRKELAAG